ncbi:MAG: acetylornithine deacetylase [Pseudomonadota bacterium]|nr:acetylornithine deacetylase [Pseudomonadota bacterium]
MTTPLTPREILDKLVSFPTVSRDSNLDLIDWVEDYLNGHGITCHRQYNEAGDKAGLCAHVGPEVAGGIVLSGHTDVVPVDGQPWTTDPFTVVEKDGKLFGRGTCDMKGFDALAIWALVEAKRRGVTRPLQIALSYDEEVGCEEVVPLIEEMQKHLPRASAVIVGEPSMMKAVTAHKGGRAFDIHVHGFEVHSSLIHSGVNAIMFGAKLIEWANEMNAAQAAGTPTETAALFVPPWTSTHVGTISGGTAGNITAKDCTFEIDFRNVPDENNDDWEARLRAKVAEVEAEMKAIVPDTWIEVTPTYDLTGLAPEVDGEAEALVRRLTGDNSQNVVSYGTEAGHFQNDGYSTVVCGPGDIAQAHQPDEFLEVAQLEAGQRFMVKLVQEVLA